MPANFASMYVDYYWQELKNWRPENPDKSIERPKNVGYYPNPKTDFIQDKPSQDSGNNYGRFRSRLISSLPPLQDYVDQMKSRELLGVPSDKWREFFNASNESKAITELEDITGIGSTTAEDLRSKGYTTPEAIKSLLIDVLSDIDGVDGVGSTTAENIIDDLSKVRVND